MSTQVSMVVILPLLLTALLELLKVNRDTRQVTESWLRHDFPDSHLLSKTDYSLLFRKDRPDDYGGVAVFVSNLLKVVGIDCEY